MLQNTFVHIPGIGPKTEQELWRSGIRSWEDANTALLPTSVSRRLISRLADYIPASMEAVEQGNAGYFERLSQMGEAWRLFPEFEHKCVYLDVETTGLSPVFDKLTMVGV